MIKNCATCGKEFNVKKYRLNTAKYCSYSCSGKYRKKIEYADKNVMLEKICESCGQPFSVVNKSKTKHKKTCSKKCQSVLQTKHLGEYRKPQEKKRGRTKFVKKCVVCGNEFIASSVNPRVQTCGTLCGIKLANKNNKAAITKDEYKKAVSESKTAVELCDKLRCSISALYRCEKRFGIKFHRREKIESIRKDGYYGYGSPKNHRNIYEKNSGIKLLPKQGVHHLDNDKSNNDIDNLFLTESTSEHRKIHNSIERVGFELYKMGYIRFDKTKKKYFLVKEKFD